MIKFTKDFHNIPQPNNAPNSLSLHLTNPPQTALIGLFGYFSLNLSPATIRTNYTPTHRPQFTSLAARSLGAWFFLCAILRLGAWHFWGEKGWYDAGMVSLGVPLFHYTVEKLVFRSVEWKQIFMAFAIDGVGLGWMWVVRGEVLGV